MKVFWGLGKVLACLFWLVVLINVLDPFIKPLHLLVNLAGALLLLVHVLELVLCNARLKGRVHPWRDRLQILFVGIFHLQTIPAPAVPEAPHA